LAARLDAQLLGRHRAERVEDVVHRLLAVQSQDTRAFRLAMRARSTGCTAASVDRALTIDRTLVVSWLCRGTLHLVGADDYWWLHRLTAPRQVAVNNRRLAHLGVEPHQVEAAVPLILDAVASGPMTRRELGHVLDRAGLPMAGQILVHLLAAASFDAHLVRGPVVAGEHCFVDAEDWLGRPAEVADRDEDLGRLASRYLVGHGPATPRDLAAYCGITLGDARRGFNRIASAGPAAGDDRTPVLLPGPRLLGMFDPVLHGWADRSFVLGDHPGVVTTNGIFRASVLLEGRVAGTWTLPNGVVTVQVARTLTADETRGVRDEADDVLRFLGLPPQELRMSVV
jgi:hypothetical protein